MKMTTGEGPWGQHLIVDVVGYTKTLSRGVVHGFVSDLVYVLKMTTLGEICIEEMHEENNIGFSAFQMITTSHVSFHEDRIHRRIYIDVFSCAEFEFGDVLVFIDSFFEPQSMTHRLITRE